MALLPSTPSREREIRHTRMLILKIMVLVAVVVVATRCFFLIQGH